MNSRFFKTSSSVVTESVLLPMVQPNAVPVPEEDSLLTGPGDEKLDVSITASIRNDNYALVNVALTPPDEGARKESVFICALDISGSMYEIAPEGKDESAGYTRLDLVKYAMNVLIETLTDKDYLGLATFHDLGFSLLKPAKMDAEGKEDAHWRIDTLKPLGGKNLWEGIKFSFNQMYYKEQSGDFCKGKNVHLLILTDGEPTTIPPYKDYITAIRNFFTEGDKFPLYGTVSTFGFSYEVNTELLVKIAKEGSGTYSFIPDATMVGTAFVNFYANALATVGKVVKLNLVPHGESKIIDVLGYPGPNLAPRNIGSVVYGQTRNILVKMLVSHDKDGNYLSAIVRYESSYEKKIIKTIIKRAPITPQQEHEIVVQFYRCVFVEEVERVVASKKRDFEELRQFFIELSTSQVKDEPRMKALFQDQHQVACALSTQEHFDRWGIHYLPALTNAHLAQKCNNFKDPGIQPYGGKVYREIQQVVNSIYMNEANKPKPSRAPPKNAFSSLTASQFQRGTVYTFHDTSSVCFDGECLVALSDGNQKKIKELIKGDLLKDNAKVICLIKNNISNGKLDLVHMNGFKLTPYHPIKINNKWSFPIDHGKLIYTSCDAVYNLVLDKTHIISINGFECVTLAHGFNDDEVLKHPYFGTNLVIEDLQKIPGWNSGFVELDDNCSIRDLVTGLIVGLQHEKENQFIDINHSLSSFIR